MLSLLDLIDAILAARGTKAAGLLLFVGWGPLLYVILFGDKEANPIGLGLLAWLSTPFMMGAALTGCVSGYRRWKALSR